MKKVEKLNKKIESLKLAILSNEKNIRIMSMVEKSFSAFILKNMRHIKATKLEINNLIKTNKDVKTYLDNYMALIASRKSHKNHIELFGKVEVLALSSKYQDLKHNVEVFQNLVDEYEKKPAVILLKSKLSLIKEKQDKNQILVANRINCQNRLKALNAVHQKNDIAKNKLSSKLEMLQ